ncbi:MAG: hypothetical protein V5A84_00745 [Planctomycetota bacterium]
MIVPLGLGARAQQVYEAKRDTSDQFDILFIAASGDGNRYGAYRTSDAGSDSKVQERDSAKKIIEWALNRARITVLTKGEYVTGADYGVTIDEDNVSLIIGPDATLAGTGDPEYPLMVRVKMADNVNVFNLGTIDTRNRENGPKGRAVQYEGHHGKKGASGVRGGIIFGSGRILNVNAGYWAIDAEKMTMPFVWSEQNMNAPIAMEGVHDMEIGTIAQLALGKGYGEGETIDMNMSCKNIHIEHVIGMAPNPGDEIVDINNGHYVTVDRLTAFQGTGYDGALLVGYDLYGHSGMESNRPKIRRQKGHVIKWTERIRKDVANFKREVSYPGFPGSLPTLRVNASLVVEFKDGSTRELVNKKYRFEL